MPITFVLRRPTVGLVMVFWLIVAATLGIVAGLVYALAVGVLLGADTLQALRNFRKRRRDARWLRRHQVPR